MVTRAVHTAFSSERSSIEQGAKKEVSLSSDMDNKKDSDYNIETMSSPADLPAEDDVAVRLLAQSGNDCLARVLGEKSGGNTGQEAFQYLVQHRQAKGNDRSGTAFEKRHTQPLVRVLMTHATTALRETSVDVDERKRSHIRCFTEPGDEHVGDITTRAALDRIPDAAIVVEPRQAKLARLDEASQRHVLMPVECKRDLDNGAQYRAGVRELARDHQIVAGPHPAAHMRDTSALLTDGVVWQFLFIHWNYARHVNTHKWTLHMSASPRIDVNLSGWTLLWRWMVLAFRRAWRYSTAPTGLDQCAFGIVADKTPTLPYWSIDEIFAVNDAVTARLKNNATNTLVVIKLNSNGIDSSVSQRREARVACRGPLTDDGRQHRTMAKPTCSASSTTATLSSCTASVRSHAVCGCATALRRSPSATFATTMAATARAW